MIDFINPDRNKIALDTDVYFNLAVIYSNDYFDYLEGYTSEPDIMNYISSIIRGRDLVSIQTVFEEFGRKQITLREERGLDRTSVENIRKFIKYGSSLVYNLDPKYNNSLGVDSKEKNDNAIAITCGTNGIGNFATCNSDDFVKTFKRIGIPKSYRLIKVLPSLKRSFMINWINESFYNPISEFVGKMKNPNSMSGKLLKFIESIFKNKHLINS